MRAGLPRRWAKPGCVLPVLLLAAAWTPAAERDGDRASRLLRSRDFERQPSLRASPRQPVLFSGPVRGNQSELARYDLEKGDYKFCVDEDDPVLAGMTLEDSNGRTMLDLDRHAGCSAVSLEAGSYTMRIRRTASAPATRAVFASPYPLRAPLLDANQKAIGGWWALRPSPLIDGLRREGRFNGRGNGVAAEYTTRVLDEWSLYNFTDSTKISPLTPATGVLENRSGTLAVNQAGNPVSQNFFLTDLGNYQFMLGWRPTPSTAQYFVPDTTSSNIMKAVAGEPPAGAQLRVVFRFFPDGTQVGAIRDGEVALFENCNYTGPTIVLIDSLPNLVAVSSGVTALDKGFRSVMVGNNTGVVFHSGIAYGGTGQLVSSNTQCLGSAQHPYSILVKPLQTLILLSSKSCPNCQLASADLSNLDLSGFDFTDANLSGAFLTKTVFHGATMLRTNLIGANLNCADFSGTQAQPHDLSTVNMTNVQVFDDPSCRSNFSWTILGAGTLPPSSWRHFDLRHAVIQNLNSEVQSTKEKPLDLQGAMLAGASLDGVTLDYATGLAGTDLSHILLNSASLRFVDLTAAKLYGARLTNANLDGIILKNAFLNEDPSGTGGSAQLGGAFLRNADLSGATLSGADFTNASFYGTATAAGATMNNTNFNGAYLAFTNFNNTTVQGVQFGNAILIGATFTGAKLSVDPGIGTNSGFEAAFLQGTNLSQAALTGTSLLNAFLDFTSGGNSLVMILGGSHTTFPGWANPGQPLCLLVIYPSGSAINDNSTLVCPSGGSGPCGAQDGTVRTWASQIDITPLASYLADSSFTPAKTPVCSNLNTDW